MAGAQASLTDTDKLAATARIWGFLKYYHPQVAEGKFNWDQKLIEIIPEVEKAQTKAELSTVFIKWIDGLGKVDVCKKCGKVNEKSFDKNFSLAWMQDPKLFSDELTSKLKYIEANRHLGKKHYAGSSESNQVLVRNEPEYKDFRYPDENYRLLSLFRYWNIIEYFFPYKYATEQKWDDVLPEMIPKFKNAADAMQYHLAMLELITKIDDSHASFVTSDTNRYFGYYWAPFRYAIIDGKAVVTGYYDAEVTAKDDVKVGDVITHINGVTVADIFEKQKKYLPASNPAVKRREAFYAIFNGDTNKAEITFDRDGVTSSKTIGRYTMKQFKYSYAKAKPTEKYKILDGNIGYVHMGILENGDVSSVLDKVWGCKAIIFDIRNYPQGTMYKVTNRLFEGRRDFVKFTEPDFDYPGKFKWSSYHTTSGSSFNKNPYKGKILILVNEDTQSHAEFTAMAFQAGDNVTVVGSQTAGADGNVTYFDFPGGYSTVITGLGVYYPDGGETQRVGIVPDVKVEPTIAGIRVGKDEVLEKAIEVVNKN